MPRVLIIFGAIALASLSVFWGGDSDQQKQLPVVENVLRIGEQNPGDRIVFSLLELKTDAALVVQENTGGVPGVVLFNETIEAGSYVNREFKLSRDMLGGEIGYVTLYTLNKGKYDSSVSVPVVDSSQNVVSSKFSVKKDE